MAELTAAEGMEEVALGARQGLRSGRDEAAAPALGRSAGPATTTPCTARDGSLGPPEGHGRGRAAMQRQRPVAPGVGFSAEGAGWG